MEDDFAFDPSLKKKKEKKVAFGDDEVLTDAPAPDATPEAGGDGVDEMTEMFASMKKKKKPSSSSKKTVEEAAAEDDEQDEEKPQPDGEDGDDLDFAADLKKKKKKKKRVDMSAFDQELGEDADTAAAAHDAAAVGAEEDIETGEEAWQKSDRDYLYPELLERFYRMLHDMNPHLVDKQGKFKMIPPSIGRDGNKKTVFANISDIAKRMNRKPDHVIQFLFTELGTTGSVDGSSRLVIRGRFQQKQIENVLRRYIGEYVSCKTCRSFDTTLSKENRLYFLNCNACGSRRSVQSIKAGFQAQIGKRKLNAPKQVAAK